jgi:MFS family permease
VKLVTNSAFVTSLTAETETRKRAWVLWTVVSLGYLLIVSQRTAPGVITDHLLKEFHLSGSMLGLMSGIQFFMYMALQIPVGLWGDRYGPTLFLLLGLICNGIGTLLYSLATSVSFLFVGRALVGFGDAMIWVNCVILLSLVFTKKSDFSVALGWTGAMGNIGGMLTTMPLAWWITASGWRIPFMVMGCVLLLHALIMWGMFRRYPVSLPASDTSHKTSFVSVLRDVLFQGRSWPPFLCHFGLVGTYTGFTSLWAVPFLMDIYQLDRTEAAGILAFGLLGAIVGGPLSGWVCDKVGECRKPYIIIHVINLTMWLLLALIPHPPLTMAYLLFFMIGVCIGGSMLTFASIRETFPPYQVGVLSGLANTGGFLSAVLLPPLMGKVLDILGMHKASSYHGALVIPCLFAVIGVLGAYMFPRKEGLDLLTENKNTVIKL